VTFDSFGNYDLNLLSKTMKTSSLIANPADVPEFIEEPHHLHVLSTKHNTHITVTKPNRDAIISVSAGNLGFRKAKRGSFDAAYQLSIHVLDKLNQGNWHSQIKKMEVVFRGFGMGRDAVTKILLGSEADKLKPKIVRVTDATRIKFGGTRSPNKRRL
jgi:small subunit ribosomal protein S11